MYINLHLFFAFFWNLAGNIKYELVYNTKIGIVIILYRILSYRASEHSRLYTDYFISFLKIIYYKFLTG